MQRSIEHSIYDWVKEIQQVILFTRPELAKIFQTYAGEAIFARKLLDINLRSIPSNSKVLEVGAGSLILSCQLSKEGYEVTALEPISQGFSHFNELQIVVLDLARRGGFCPEILELHAEQLDKEKIYDFAFSINVMEHVDNVSQVIYRVADALKPDAVYRFICPNYSFPYEPHFNIPIIFSKKVTEAVFKNKIFTNSEISDPIGTWRSINWISVRLVRDIALRNNIEVFFNKSLLSKMLERVVSDPIFRARRPSWLKLIFELVIKLKLHQLTQYIPVGLQPTIDCSIFSTSRMQKCRKLRRG